MTQSQQPLKPVTLLSRIANLAMIAGTLLSLILGVVLSFLGVAVTEFALVSLTEAVPFGQNIPEVILTILLGFGIISLAFGVILLVVHFYATRKESETYTPASSTALALSVAAEFMIGAWLLVVGIGNFDAGQEGLPWSLATIAVLGLLLVIDSVLLYRRSFKKVTLKKSGD